MIPSIKTRLLAVLKTDKKFFDGYASLHTYYFHLKTPIQRNLLAPGTPAEQAVIGDPGYSPSRLQDFFSEVSLFPREIS